MTKPRSPRRVDLESLERDYRAGTLSIGQMAVVHKCSRAYIAKEAKKYGWERDLSARVAAATQAKLATAHKPLDAAGEAQAVEEAAAIRIGVVLGHRGRIAKTQGLVDRLHTLVDSQIDALETWKAEDYQKRDRLTKKKLIALILGPSEMVQTVRTLADAQAKLITMERQAFGIVDSASAPTEKPYEERLRDLMDPKPAGE